ncbi:hypothetical protein PENPOL_c013G01843 [Penicillium polonicum]|uniref:C2H2-type domain-containing protein n=1 Tax=Penicillium polonicum TaxID=60169 RepID=A0A1V6NCE6_PENPO|nr:hypothetical protein PENPOL_c013G01843 [Penicillium polonicum]
MFPGGSGSQEPFSSRNQSNLPVSDSKSNVGLSSPVQLVETSDFSQSVLPGSGSLWPIQNIHSSISTVQGGSQSTQGFALPLPSHHSTNTDTSRPPTLPGSNYPPTESTVQSSIEDTTPIKQEIGSEDRRGLGISSYPMSVASDTYFAGPMQHNPHQYAWTNRPYQPLQPPGQMSPPFPSSHPSYPPSGYPMGYPSHLNGPVHGYQQQEHQIPASYLAAPGNLSRHSQPRGPPVARSYHTQSASGTPQSEQHLMTSPPPYMINQHPYYFPDTSAIPPHPTSISSPPPSMTAPEPIYSSPESATAKDSDPIRVLSLRPRPQCWDHGCNGREFSTFSNLLRHQREKSGVVAKAECPICGAVFTRTTARNIHVAQGKCKSSGRDSSAE